MDINSFEVDSPPSNSLTWSNMLESFTALQSLKFLILGSVLETGRRLCQWLIGRLRFQYSIAAQFDEDDPAYEWIVHFLTQENVWQGSRDFRITSKTCKRKWGIKTGSDPTSVLNADYVPTYEKPQLFRWKGYWVEIKRTSSMQNLAIYRPESQALTLRVFTFDMTILSSLVEEAHRRYVDVNKPNVTIHLIDSPNSGLWTNVKRKFRRPLSSIILKKGVIESLLSDAQEFMDNEDWYITAGIPYRRGYLLAGPPGTGKTSTIYTIAGELGLEIYSISLASGFVDDAFLQLAASSIPKSSIFLIEDIDCAFSREDEQDQPSYQMSYRGRDRYRMPSRRSPVTLSGLLNVIDGVGSEEGKLFFATTNDIDRLDPALLRPGRIDMKIQYGLATQAQAKALFIRFYPESQYGATTHTSIDSSEKQLSSPASGDMSKLAEDFAALIPDDEFSTAELQGYLLTCKKQPVDAVAGVAIWIEQERTERREREQREKQKHEKMEAVAQKMSRAAYPPFYPAYPAYPTYPAQVYPAPVYATPVSTDIPSELPSPADTITAEPPTTIK